MDIWRDIYNIVLNDQKPKDNIPLTSTITAYLLRKAMGKNPGYKKEAGILDKFLSPIFNDEQIQAAYKGFHIFSPDVSDELLNRYEAIKKELDDTKPDLLIVGACGLSPLGLAYAMENPDKQVVDTDLSEIVVTRQIPTFPKPSNHQISRLDLLDEEAIKEFGQRIREAASATGLESLAIVIEGLTFYLDDEQRERLNKNLQTLVKKIKPENPEATFIFDYFTWWQPSRDRDIKSNSDHSLWKIFQNLTKNITSGQKCFMKDIEEVKEYLATQNFINIRHSRYSAKGNAHNVYVCEYRSKKNERCIQQPEILTS
ncbi:MAG: hypothetical protein KAT43_03970 [Nanoarchaeota archaeon]|nr:hypothetical protein [Nanoarchaeota archaeon]